MRNVQGLIAKCKLFGILLVFFALSGCMYLTQYDRARQHDVPLVKFPTYAETKRTWGTVPEGHGRVVVIRDYDESGFCYPYDLQVDQMSKVTLFGQTFVFVDLLPGKHSLDLDMHNVFAHPHSEVDVLPGEISYIYRFYEKLRPMTNQEAERLLKDEAIRHLFKQPLPFNKQDQHAERFKCLE